MSRSQVALPADEGWITKRLRTLMAALELSIAGCSVSCFVGCASPTKLALRPDCRTMLITCESRRLDKRLGARGEDARILPELASAIPPGVMRLSAVGDGPRLALLAKGSELCSCLRDKAY